MCCFLVLWEKEAEIREKGRKETRAGDSRMYVGLWRRILSSRECFHRLLLWTTLPSLFRGSRFGWRNSESALVCGDGGGIRERMPRPFPSLYFRQAIVVINIKVIFVLVRKSDGVPPRRKRKSPPTVRSSCFFFEQASKITSNIRQQRNRI